MTEATGPHVLVEDLRIGWGTVVLMEHVSFQIERGETFVLLGGSGCGKSTLLRHLIGLERPKGGRILIDGEPHLFEGVPPFGVMFQSGAAFRPDLRHLSGAVICGGANLSDTPEEVSWVARRASGLGNGCDRASGR